MDVQNRNSRETLDLVVIGGGLAGLTAATLAAKQGLNVRLVEKSKQLGGRAATNRRGEVYFNLGPHALYCAGEAFRTMRELHIPISGGPPQPGDSALLLNGKAHPWPMSLTSLLRSKLFTWKETWQLASLIKRIQRVDPTTWQHTTVHDWTRQFAGDGNLSRLVRTLFRLTTFVNDPQYQSAGSAIENFVLGNEGVWYLDRGWQTMADGLTARAGEFGADICRSQSAVRVTSIENGVHTQLDDGTTLASRCVIVATPPQDAVRLLGVSDDHPLRERVRSARPALAACLDVALSSLPKPRTRFVLGLDEPIYYSVHSGAAKLGPDGVVVLSLMRYVGPELTASGEETERELECVLDELQPGWRSLVVERRYLPRMTVVTDVPAAHLGGTSGRVESELADRPGVFLAGDWIGEKGQLADAAVASARDAVERVIRRHSQTRSLEFVS